MKASSNVPARAGRAVPIATGGPIRQEMTIEKCFLFKALPRRWRKEKIETRKPIMTANCFLFKAPLVRKESIRGIWTRTYFLFKPLPQGWRKQKKETSPA